MAAFVANVGVNAAHSARSPLFDDGSFELLPIPERHSWRQPMLRLKDLPRLSPYAPRTWSDRPVHLDPDLTSDAPTYGDNCRTAGRAFSLRRAQPGDVIVFVARLHPGAERAGFYLVGCLDVAGIVADVVADPGSGWWDGNAHVRRARATGTWDSFWVFKGGTESRLFERAVPFGWPEAADVFGAGWAWPEHRTELQTIGSHTRAVRRVDGPGEEWLRAICRS